MKFIGSVLVIAFALSGIVACEMKIWKECREEHGVLYCMRTLG